MDDKIKICLWASVQEKNIGVDGYGTEEENMFRFCDIVEDLLSKYGVFEILRNRPEWKLYENVAQELKNSPDFTLEFHTNASNVDAEGTEVYCNTHNEEGLELATILYKHLAPVSNGNDRGVKDGMHLYDIRKTANTCVLAELFFHDNPVEVMEWLRPEKVMQYAIAVEKAVCEFCQIPFRCHETPRGSNNADIYQVLDEVISRLTWLKNNI